jgi:hypothetical protein
MEGSRDCVKIQHGPQNFMTKPSPLQHVARHPPIKPIWIRVFS